MDVALIILLVLIALAVVLVLYGINIYNRLISLKNNVTQSWANIDVLLRQRHDELPKLVETCKQYMNYERDTLAKVMQARAGVYDANQKGDLNALGSAETELRTGLGRLFAVAEAYPDLKSSETFQHLQERISGLESSIADRREFYNEAVTLFNTRIELFPDLIIAKRYNFRQGQTLTFSEEEKKDVDIKSLFG